jgi:Glutathionylspermidine synthase.
MRFDFHLATDGWRVSEVNSDVPGGFTEASAFTRLMAAHYPNARMAGDPLEAWTRAMLASVGDAGAVALLSAPGYMEDQQVTALLGGALRRHGIATHLIHRPEQLTWRSGRAELTAGSAPLGAIVRFYQAEWISRFRRGAGSRSSPEGGHLCRTSASPR